jgi:hypothetical protein
MKVGSLEYKVYEEMMFKKIAKLEEAGRHLIAQEHYLCAAEVLQTAKIFYTNIQAWYIKDDKKGSELLREAYKVLKQ